MMRSCIILCGGRSRRMGQDKGLLILNDKPMIIHVIETLEKLVDEIIVVFRDKKQLNYYKKQINNYKKHLQDQSPLIKLTTDVKKDQGPMVGLLTGLSHVKSEGALVLPCDSPYVSIYFVNTIFKCIAEDESNKFLATVPQWHDGSVEPLHSYYLKECIPLIKNRLEEGFKDVRSLFKIIEVNYVDVEFLDPEKMSFKNLNRPEDLDKL